MTGPGLSAQQTASFRRDGWLALDTFFPDEELALLLGEIDGVVRARAASCVAEGRLPPEVLELGFEQQLTAVDVVDPDFVFGINRGRLSGPGVFSVMTSPRLLDVMSGLLGDEIVASAGYRIRPKMPGFFHCVLPWHQDSAVFEPACDEHLIVTAWVALAESTPERGCLELLSGAHQDGLFRHIHRRGQPNVEIDPAVLPGTVPSLAPVGRGGLVLFTNMTPHRSLPNTTDRIRWSIDLRYQSALGPPHNFGAPPGAASGCFPPEADVLVRSRARPGETVRDWEAFDSLRNGHLPAAPADRWQLGAPLAPFFFEGSV